MIKDKMMKARAWGVSQWEKVQKAFAPRVTQYIDIRINGKKVSIDVEQAQRMIAGMNKATKAMSKGMDEAFKEMDNAMKEVMDDEDTRNK